MSSKKKHYVRQSCYSKHELARARAGSGRGGGGEGVGGARGVGGFLNVTVIFQLSPGLCATFSYGTSVTRAFGTALQSERGSEHHLIPQFLHPCPWHLSIRQSVPASRDFSESFDGRVMPVAETLQCMFGWCFLVVRQCFQCSFSKMHSVCG